MATNAGYDRGSRLSQHYLNIAKQPTPEPSTAVEADAAPQPSTAVATPESSTTDTAVAAPSAAVADGEADLVGLELEQLKWNTDEQLVRDQDDELDSAAGSSCSFFGDTLATSWGGTPDEDAATAAARRCRRGALETPVQEDVHRSRGESSWRNQEAMVGNFGLYFNISGTRGTLGTKVVKGLAFTPMIAK